MYRNALMDGKSAQPITRSGDRVAEGDEPTRHGVAKRIALAAGTTLAAVNIWTGAPLLALWIGSRVQGDSGLSMGTIFVVVIVLATLEFLLGVSLSWLSATYDRVSGRRAEVRQTPPWLRSMRGEREQQARKRHRVSLIERIVMISVAAGVIAFEVWFFFFAGSPI